jgi:DNA-binding beta-propeller fold protein YncE
MKGMVPGFISIAIAMLVPGFFARPASLDTALVKFDRVIHLNGGRGKKSLKNIILGKTSKKDIKPSAICRINPHLLCITDAVNGSVIIMDNNGNIKKKISRVKGLRLISPVSACVDDTGNIYVSDSARQVVVRFDRKYKFKGIFISPSLSGGRITGLVFMGGIFYCVDTANHRVLCFDRQGELRFIIGKRGTAEGQFNFPTHIAAGNGMIYVVDALNFRVQVFDDIGKFIRVFGTPGRGGGNFSKPKGIAVDGQGRIFVADAMFDNVQIFDSQGRFLYYFGGPGQGQGEFWMPTGIMVDIDKTIWVADTYNNRLQIFKLVEKAK